MAFASSNGRASCSIWFSSVGRTDIAIHDQADAYGAAARAMIQKKLRLAVESSNKKARPIFRRSLGNIELIPDDHLPKDPKIARLIQRANVALQSENEILDFAEATAKRAALMRLSDNPKTFDPTRFLRASPQGGPLLATLAKETGWGELIVVPEILDTDVFRQAVLGGEKLFYDLEGAEVSHTGSAHALQWLMITPILEREFGEGSARQLWRFLSSKEGFYLWRGVFDRGQGYVRDLRGPQAFGVYGLAGPQSWLGVD